MIHKVNFHTMQSLGGIILTDTKSIELYHSGLQKYYAYYYPNWCIIQYICVYVCVHACVYMHINNTREKRDIGKGKMVHHWLGYEGQCLGVKGKKQ